MLAGHGMEPRIIVEVAEQRPIDFLEYARIPIAYEVRAILEVVASASGSGGPVLRERSLENPYLKDYDAIAGEGPLTWSRRFDLSDWGVFMARIGQRQVGGAAVVINSPDVDMLEGCGDLILIWDIRVALEARGRGVGSALFRSIEEWCKAWGGRQLKVETRIRTCRHVGSMLARVVSSEPSIASPTVTSQTRSNFFGTRIW